MKKLEEIKGIIIMNNPGEFIQGDNLNDIAS